MSLLIQREPMQNRHSVSSLRPTDLDPIQKTFSEASWPCYQRGPIQKRLSVA